MAGHNVGDRKDDTDRFSNPALRRPKPVADALWIVDDAPVQAFGLSLPIRIVIVRTRSSGVILFSPVRHCAALARQIADIGPVRHIVAPSTGHWRFVKEWQRASPDALCWNAPGLADRRPVRASGVRFDRTIAFGAQADWLKDFEIGSVRGGPFFAECWFFHRASGSLILTDLVSDLDPAELPPVTALVMRLALGTAGTTPLHIRTALLADRNANRERARRMIACRPDRVLFAHGRWFDRQGAEKLRRALAWLL